MSGFSISNIFFILALLLPSINSVVTFFTYSSSLRTSQSFPKIKKNEDSTSGMIIICH